jgi:hypothetical protein
MYFTEIFVCSFEKKYFVNTVYIIYKGSTNVYNLFFLQKFYIQDHGPLSRMQVLNKFTTHLAVTLILHSSFIKRLDRLCVPNA